MTSAKLLNRLLEMSGEFYVVKTHLMTEMGLATTKVIRHGSIMDRVGRPACPLTVLCHKMGEHIQNNDIFQMAKVLGVTVPEVLWVIDQADLWSDGPLRRILGL
jgi:hypothetical protein